MTALLITACGATRTMNVPDRRPIVIPYSRPLTHRDFSDRPDEEVRVHRRIFIWEGWLGEFAVFREEVL